jgi:hypothetical protein
VKKRGRSPSIPSLMHLILLSYLLPTPHQPSNSS